jgi:radical SAM protein with 4Fe4S-binding SPASM domain
VVTHVSIGELAKLYAVIKYIAIATCRRTAIEPMGRALEHSEKMLTPDDHRQLLRFIKEERMKGMPLSYGCCHFLGTEFEHEVRDWYFLCAAGRTVASITANGDIRACLDIERTPETLQGNILKDDFTEVWRNGFRTFRHSLAEENADCSACPHKRICDGGSRHSWDAENHRQRICMRGVLFD